MQSNHRPRLAAVNTALLALCGGMLLSAGGTAWGQASAGDLGRVTVTGSNIKRTDTETASPVQVISKQEIEQTGKGTVAEYLQTLSADGQGSVPFTYGRGFAGGTSAGISLRGLGANATLVLVNGRRVAPAVLADDAQRSFVDLNQIPMEAVERVEVLKDGASSIYGSDAVAGVVNIILKKSYKGTAAKITYGVSQEGDGQEPRVALTHGFGDLEREGYNVLLNVEAGRKQPVYYRDRSGNVGASALAVFGFDPNEQSNNLSRVGGNGWLPSTASGDRTVNSASQSIIGNARAADDVYHSRGEFFPAAQAFCDANVNLPQTNPYGACITDVWRRIGQIQPRHETGSLYGRLTKQINATTEGFVELGFYQSKSSVDLAPLVPSGTVYQPTGNPIPNVSSTMLGANHPDNPYPGTASRLSYNPVLETGPATTQSKSHSIRFAAGIRGAMGSWDYDTGITFSESTQTDTAKRRINRLVSNALLNPTPENVAAATAISPAYAALPAGTYWRIGENAYLNSPEMYAALLQDQTRDGYARQYGVDFKVSRELGQLDGGPIGVAFGAELRHEANSLPFYTGLGDYIGVSLTSYEGERNIFATYGEVLLPVTKRIELTGALRFDRYSDAGNAITPKVGAKFKASKSLALRGTYAYGFRAPSSTENSPASIAAFSGPIINDEERCAAGIAASDCRGISPAFVVHGNPDLEPEKSQSTTLGVVWDITAKTSAALDLWQIKRTGLPVNEDAQGAIDAGNLIRDPSSSQGPGDPGLILVGILKYVNSAESLTRGIDLDFKHQWDLSEGRGRLTAGLTWSHLLVQRVIDADGTVHDYAGTHGNCDITNCMGSPRDRISAALTWELAQWRLGANINHRGSFSNKLQKSADECESHLLDGSDAPPGCKIDSFTTLDLSAAWKLAKSTEVFGSIQNVTNARPPLDPVTYGAIGYNPLDYAGALGRYFRIGLKHQF